jgi:dTDP-4-amino-4,6-dideoxygalactose transaminase
MPNRVVRNIPDPFVNAMTDQLHFRANLKATTLPTSLLSHKFFPSKMIPLSRPAFFETEITYIRNVLESGKIGGQGPYTQKCEAWLEKSMSTGKAFLTTSGSAALVLACLIANIKPGDEVIFPSYTYVSTVNSFVTHGAVPVFVDVESNTMNMNADKVEAAVTPKTRAIVPVHYAGVSVDMDTVMDIARRYKLLVIEDSAQAMTSTYKGRPLGTIGDISTISFHETKNFTSGQGGAVLVNRNELIERAEVLYDNGTDRAQFFRGKVDQYSWKDVGSNFVVSEVLAALLWAQFEKSEQIQKKRHQQWTKYQRDLEPLAAASHVVLPFVPAYCQHNAHVYYLKVNNPQERQPLMMHLKGLGISSAPHYTPLHTTKPGLEKGRLVGEDEYTTLGSQQLLRLPLYHDLTEKDQNKVVEGLNSFWSQLGLTNGAH